MNTKDKARELVDRYYTIWKPLVKTTLTKERAKERSKQCALIAVDEILEALNYNEYHINQKKFNYWQEVKEEINNV